MNRSRSSTQLYDKAITSFLYFKSAEGLRDRTIYSYQYTLTQCLDHWGPVDIKTLTSQKISEYLSWLRNDYVPKRFGQDTSTLSIWLRSDSMTSFYRLSHNKYLFI